MSGADHRMLRTNLGAYALGHLDPEEAGQVEEHLRTCSTCRAEYDELLPVAGALAGLRDPTGSGPGLSTDDGGAPPPDLEGRVVRQVREARSAEQRRGWLRSAALVAGGAVAASAVLGVAVGLRDDAESPAVPLEAVDVLTDAPGVEAEADLVAHTWGVEVKLTATGFDRGDRYRVVVVGEDGRSYPAGGFVGTGTVEMHCNLNSTVLRDSAAGFEVRDVTGQVVATSAFST